jgi:hypothetical protein
MVHGPRAGGVGHSSGEAAYNGNREVERKGAEVTAATFALFVYAVGAVESGWRCDLARGPAGELGPLQITPAITSELNRRRIRDDAGREWRHEWCVGAGYSIQACRAYLDAVAPGASPERWARVWRKGPTGWRRESARVYWGKVKKVMEGRSTNKEQVR